MVELDQGNKNECEERKDGGMKMKEMMLIEKETRDCVNSRMPTLCEEDLAWVNDHERRRWAHGWMAGLVDGQVHWFGSDGIMMAAPSVWRPPLLAPL